MNTNPATHKKNGPTPLTRRKFMATGATALLGSSVGAQVVSPDTSAPESNSPPAQPNGAPASATKENRGYSRFHPSQGGPPENDNPTYLGKLVPGIRDSGLEPVLVHAPDLEKLPWEMVNGAKEFHLHCEHVPREFLPGYVMNVWGYNGGMPGPVIEAYQGDRVRLVVHNHLPEPTTVHWHGLELPVQFDGVPGLTQEFIPPGETYVYEFDLHQTGTFFYHSHVAMQEAFGMVGLFIIHPRVAYDPPVDRDFALIFQNFFIPPNSDTADSMRMDWNWHTINGRSGPYATPLVCKLGERVRVRLLDFSPMQHHPIHLHGHTFWLTGTEGGRIPPSAWIPRNTTLVGVAMVQDFEFVAFNPGDWIFHCHMVHHMMNHMVEQVGPRIRTGVDVDDYIRALPNRPAVDLPHDEPGFKVIGYPQKMRGMSMQPAAMKKITGKREARGMRHNWFIAPKGLMTVLRVLPEDLYTRVMDSDEDLKPGEIFDAVLNGDYQQPKKA